MSALLAPGRVHHIISDCTTPRRGQIGLVCNTYVIKPKRGAQGLALRVSEESARLPSALVRKSDPGVVIRADGQAELMRWGFHREFNPSINNARSDKLEGGMWAGAFRARRCVIPMTLFYEWGAGPGGRKQAHEFHDPDNNYLWVAGIWEENPDLGPCYSMVTTTAPLPMSPIHDRMPAILPPDDVEGYLAGSGDWNFQPFAGSLVVKPCASPLVKPRDGGEQREFF